MHAPSSSSSITAATATVEAAAAVLAMVAVDREKWQNFRQISIPILFV